MSLATTKRVDGWVSALDQLAKHYSLPFEAIALSASSHPGAEALATQEQWRRLGREIISGKAEPLIVPGTATYYAEASVADIETNPLTKWSVPLFARKRLRTLLGIETGKTLEDYIAKEVRRECGGRLSAPSFMEAEAEDAIVASAEYAVMRRVGVSKQRMAEVIEQLSSQKVALENCLSTEGEYLKLGNTVASVVRPVLQGIGKAATQVAREHALEQERMRESDERVSTLRDDDKREYRVQFTEELSGKPLYERRNSPSPGIHAGVLPDGQSAEAARGGRHHGGSMDRGKRGRREDIPGLPSMAELVERTGEADSTDERDLGIYSRRNGGQLTHGDVVAVSDGSPGRPVLSRADRRGSENVSTGADGDGERDATSSRNVGRRDTAQPLTGIRQRDNGKPQQRASSGPAGSHQQGREGGLAQAGNRNDDVPELGRLSATPKEIPIEALTLAVLASLSSSQKEALAKNRYSYREQAASLERKSGLCSSTGQVSARGADYSYELNATGLTIKEQGELREAKKTYKWQAVARHIGELCVIGKINDVDYAAWLARPLEPKEALQATGAEKDTATGELASLELAFQKNAEEAVAISGVQLTALQVLAMPEHEADEASMKAHERAWKAASEAEGTKRDALRRAVTLEDVPRGDYRIQSEDFGEATPKVRFRKNISALSLLAKLERAAGLASAAEQEVLSGYSGWGALPEVFDETKGAWKKEHAELRGLLSPEEYSKARASTLNAHFTPPVITRALWQALGDMGFSGGNVLEPALGIGNFIGTMPAELLSKSKVYGVELEGLSAGIAAHLYPSAAISACGFEQTAFEDNSFDVAISNIPFGNYKVFDKDYNAHKFFIHDYFIAKSLDKVRPGGIVAFITSTGTLDKQNACARRYFDERAELIGAVRLGGGAFKANAGTEVASDIIILKKREVPALEASPWTQVQATDDGFHLNKYFVDNPRQVLGEISEQATPNRYNGQPERYLVWPDGKDLKKALAEALGHICTKGTYAEASHLTGVGEGEAAGRKSIPAIPGVKDYSHALAEGELYFREGSRMFETGFENEKETTLVKDFVVLRDALGELIAYECRVADDEAIAPLRETLNNIYDAFALRHGRLTDMRARKLLQEDSTYALACALEELDADTQRFVAKADIFTRRTILPKEPVTQAGSAVDALACSMREVGRVDMDYIGSLCALSADELKSELQGLIYFDPAKESWVSSAEYLSGKVKEKLARAKTAEDGKDYTANVAALEKVIPQDIAPSDIALRLGVSWVSVKDYGLFIKHLFNANYEPTVIHNHLDNEWQIVNKGSSWSLPASEIYGTKKKSGWDIVEDALNQRATKVTKIDPQNSEKRILDREATELAREKRASIEEAFKQWFWADEERTQRYVRHYNDLYNATVERSFEGSTLSFEGMNNSVELREHQKCAIARILYGGNNTLLAHEVGAGKTYTIAAAAMEMKRIGLAKKPLITVPKAIVGQWAHEFMKLYPAAHILVASERDFKRENRRRFCGRVALGEWDAVILTHEQFERIKCSKEMRTRAINEEIEAVDAVLGNHGYATYKDNINASWVPNQKRRSIKSFEKTRRQLEAKLLALDSEEKDDNVLDFEALGIDALFVDEGHRYKSLGIRTSMDNVLGIHTGESQRALDMLTKCRYLQGLATGNIVFATGTPVTNTMTELYNIMRYLMPTRLEELGLYTFDAWAASFGEAQIKYELRPEGEGFVERTRFARFYNLPELMALFKEVADIQTEETLGLPVPKAHFYTEAIAASPFQKEYIASLGERAEIIRRGAADPSKDNMLKITSEGRKCALDVRCLDAGLSPGKQCKSGVLVENVVRIWRESADVAGTQIVFSDLSTPKTDGAGFSVYEDIRKRLIAHGIPDAEVAFIHDATTNKARAALMARVNSGTVRIILGSTEKLGTGVNVQERLVAAHDLDCPWRPSDLKQRLGRIVRQGNINSDVDIYRYVTVGTFDAYMWQTIENKQRFISQIMTSKVSSRVVDDIDEATLSAAEVKALACGSPLIKEKMECEVELARLTSLAASHKNSQWRIGQLVSVSLPGQKQETELLARRLEKDLMLAKQNPPEESNKGFRAEIAGMSYSRRSEAAEAIRRFAAGAHGTNPVDLGNYRGFALALSYAPASHTHELLIKGHTTQQVSFELNRKENLMLRVDNALLELEKKLEEALESLRRIALELTQATEQLGAPFERAAELEEVSRRYKELEKMLEEGEMAKDKNGEVRIQASDEKNRKCLPAGGKYIVPDVKQTGAQRCALAR